MLLLIIEITVVIVALFCTIFDIFNMKEYCDLEI